MATERLLVVGDVFVDYLLEKKVVRLGGVFHAARALDAMSREYALATFHPDYLDGAVEKYARELHAAVFTKVGVVTGAPSVVLIGEATEAGDQGYDEVLHEARASTLDATALEKTIEAFKPTRVLVFPGKYDLPAVISIAKKRNVPVALDVQYAKTLRQVVDQTGGWLDTIFASTSGPLFTESGSSPAALVAAAQQSLPELKNVVIKENRGGSRAHLGDQVIEAPAFSVPTVHSVGVGDCFNCAWLTSTLPPDQRLRFASFAAALYASTLKHEEFVGAVRTLGAEPVGVAGVRLAWESRPDCHVYLAAPDFPAVDTAPLDRLEANLKYHNFSPHRPIKENGLCRPETTQADQRKMFGADLELLARCQLMIVVVLGEDSGMYVEQGMYFAAGKPVIVFDPLRRLNNMFASRANAAFCTTFGQTIDAAFKLAGKKQL